MKLFVALVISLSILAPSTALSDERRGFSFFLADSDKDQLLSPGEFRKFINLLADAGHTNAQRVRTFKLYGLALSRVDKDGDGAASPLELLETKASYQNNKN